jgi:hypothetical protein
LSLVAPQPAPRASEAAPLWPIVIMEARDRLSGNALPLLLADMAERDAFGRAKYPFPLAPKNGRDFLVDLYQELLDAVVYARGEIEEGDPSGEAAAAYPVLLARALRVREALARREGARAAIRSGLAALGYPRFDNHTPEAFGRIGLGDHLDMPEEARRDLARYVERCLGVRLGRDGRAAMTIDDLARTAERALAEKARRA